MSALRSQTICAKEKIKAVCEMRFVREADSAQTQVISDMPSHQRLSGQKLS
jgi:hypothetical protein